MRYSVGITLAIVSLLIAQGSVVHANGKVVPCTGCSFGSPYASLTPLNAQLIVSASYTNRVMTFNVTGDEIAQGFYLFYMNSYGNGSLTIQFIGTVPGTVQLGNVLQVSSYAAGIETLFDTGQKASGNICIVYTGGCSSTNTGGGSGGNGNGGISGVVSNTFNQIGGVNTGIVIIIVFIGFILAIGLVASRQRDKRQ